MGSGRRRGKSRTVDDRRGKLFSCSAFILYSVNCTVGESRVEPLCVYMCVRIRRNKWSRQRENFLTFSLHIAHSTSAQTKDDEEAKKKKQESTKKKYPEKN